MDPKSLQHPFGAAVSEMFDAVENSWPHVIVELELELDPVSERFVEREAPTLSSRFRRLNVLLHECHRDEPPRPPPTRHDGADALARYTLSMSSVARTEVHARLEPRPMQSGLCLGVLCDQPLEPVPIYARQHARLYWHYSEVLHSQLVGKLLLRSFSNLVPCGRRRSQHCVL